MTCSAREGLCPLFDVLFFCIKVLQGKIFSVFSCPTDYMYIRLELEPSHYFDSVAHVPADEFTHELIWYKELCEVM